MRILLLIVCLFLLTISESFSQRFDWQYSSRFPQSTPKLFVGPSLSANYSLHSGSLDLTEEQTSCCSFSSGYGVGFDIGVNVEYWLDDRNTFLASAGIHSFMGDFSNAGDVLPIVDETIFRTEYDYQSSMNFIYLTAGIKRYFGKSSFYYSGNVGLAFLASDEGKHIERIVSEHTFNDGSKERSITNGEIDGKKGVIFFPELQIGYDISISNGIFSSQFLSIRYPIGGLSSETDWQLFSFSAGISVFIGLF